MANQLKTVLTICTVCSAVASWWLVADFTPPLPFLVEVFLYLPALLFGACLILRFRLPRSSQANFDWTLGFTLTAMAFMVLAMLYCLLDAFGDGYERGIDGNQCYMGGVGGACNGAEWRALIWYGVTLIVATIALGVIANSRSAIDRSPGART